MGDTINLKLRIWRQPGPDAPGKLVNYDLPDVSVHSSFLEMMDQLNRNLTEQGEEMVEFDSDCREGICGMCGLVIGGIAHGPVDTTTCQLHMREFSDGETITIEPWRAGPFPVIKDLVVDRTAFDRIIAAGGFVSVATGGAPDANALPVGKETANEAMNAATCIGCGACVAACPNGSAALFVGAKLSHLALLPQGDPERVRRAQGLVQQMDSEGFGNCSNHGECEAVCPKQIPIRFIAKMKREWLRSVLKGS
jgi:succinate dehydrogenase / fumarate reductase, iron-sulfur subunit